MKTSTIKNLFILIAFVSGLAVLVQGGRVWAASSSTFSQVISDGVQSVDVVDQNGAPVGSPKVAFTPATFSFDTQTVTGALGVASEKIRVFNPSSDVTWTVSLAATSGPTAKWDSGSATYDFNDSKADGTDDSDQDGIGGRLTLNPTAGTVAGVPNDNVCSPNNGITKGTQASFQEINPSVNSITLFSGTATAYCRWDFSSIGLSQVIPGSQVGGTYNLSFTITIA